jgi:predicted Zn-dependent protease
MFDRLQLAIDTGAKSTVTGARFHDDTISWGFAPSQHATSAEVAAASNAFAAWAAASGLRFVEAAANQPTDITVDFKRLNTANTGVVGLTSSSSVGGYGKPGALIQLEDPTETPLVADSSGQLVYSGTEATLTQVLMHEIGHALGLGDNADPTSVESYYLGTSNRTISQSDSDAIHYLYSSPAEGGPYISQGVLDLMKTFASFAPAAGASAVHLVGIVQTHLS